MSRQDRKPGPPDGTLPGGLFPAMFKDDDPQETADWLAALDGAVGLSIAPWVSASPLPKREGTIALWCICDHNDHFGVGEEAGLTEDRLEPIGKQPIQLGFVFVGRDDIGSG